MKTTVPNMRWMVPWTGTMKTTELAWMAGILDLRGRILHKDNKLRNTRQLVMSVDSQEIAIIRRMGGLTGTSPELKAAKGVSEFLRRGCGEHCPEPHFHVNDSEYPRSGLPPIARWTITGAGMVVVYQNLKPFLTIDRYEEAAREADMGVILDGQGSGMVLSSLYRLRNLGWILSDRYTQALDDRLRANVRRPAITATVIDN